MFGPGFGVWELLIILVIIIVIFGVGRLPEIGGAIGKSISEFKSSIQGEGDLEEDAEDTFSASDSVSDKAKS